MADPQELATGDTVSWTEPPLRPGGPERVFRGKIVRMDHAGLWADVRFPIAPGLFKGVTHLTRRIRVIQLHLVSRASKP